MKLFLVLHTWIKVNRYLEIDKVVKKMVGQLVIEVVHDNAEEEVDKVTNMIFLLSRFSVFWAKTLRVRSGL